MISDNVSIIQQFSKENLKQLSTLTKSPTQIVESFSVTIKSNSILGAFIENRLTLIYVPKETNCFLTCWEGDKALNISNKNKECLFAIGENVPFSIDSKSKTGISITISFNLPSKDKFWKIADVNNSNSKNSKYYLKATN